MKNPSLIVDKSPGEAHLAIILTKIPDGLNDLKERLMPESEYVTRKDIKTFNHSTNFAFKDIFRVFSETNLT